MAFIAFSVHCVFDYQEIGLPGALWEGSKDLTPILGSGPTKKKHVLEMNWMVISGYVPQ